MTQQNKQYEIFFEYTYGNVRKIFFRCEHKSLYSDYDKYLIAKEGKKGYAVYSVNAFNELWYLQSARTLNEIFERYGLDYKTFKKKAEETISRIDGAITRKISI